MQKGARVTRSRRRRWRGRAEQPREGESPVPAAGGLRHPAVPMEAAPPPPVTAGLLSPSLPPCSPRPERSHGQSGLSLVRLPVPGVAGTETPPELPAPADAALPAVAPSHQPAASSPHVLFFYTYGVDPNYINSVLKQVSSPPQGLSRRRPESPLSSLAADRLLTLRQHYIIPSKFKTNPAVPEGLGDLCALTILEIHFKSRQDPTDA